MGYWLKHNWIAVVVLLAIVGSFAVSHYEATSNESASVARSVATCNRGNAGRAYLQIRAQEFPVSVKTGASFTTTVAPAQYAILNCEKTTAAGDQPVPVEAAVEAAYLDAYRSRRILLLKNGQITGSVGFPAYFGR